MPEARTLYVSRKLENAPALIAWAKSQGFETTQLPEDMHVTVVYSKTKLSWPEPHENTIAVKLKGARSVKPLGDKGAVVLRFEDPTLAARHEQLLEAGAKSDFPTFQPHVTITWDGKGVDLSKVVPYDGDLVFGPEIFKEVDEGWMANHTEKFFKAKVTSVDKQHGLVFGWAMISKVDGEDYYDLHGDNIEEDEIIKCTLDYMLHSRLAGDMHVRQVKEIKGEDGTITHVEATVPAGKIVYGFPLTTDIAKSFGIETKKTGFLIAMKPDSEEVLGKFASGEYTGFSIGGYRGDDEEVK